MKSVHFSMHYHHTQDEYKMHETMTPGCSRNQCYTNVKKKHLTNPPISISRYTYADLLISLLALFFLFTDASSNWSYTNTVVDIGMNNYTSVSASSRLSTRAASVVAFARELPGRRIVKEADRKASSLEISGKFPSASNLSTIMAPAAAPFQEPVPAQNLAIGPSSYPPPATTPAPVSSSCPALASACDFYFSGFKGEIPTFSLNVRPDSAISPPILVDIRGATIEVVAGNSGSVDYVDCKEDNISVLRSDSQFYISQRSVNLRTVQSDPGIMAYADQFVRIYFTSIALNIFGMVTNVNKGESSEYFPEDRRCIAFRTTIF